jgi:tetraacyldisaccharide 4'-kinase
VLAELAPDAERVEDADRVRGAHALIERGADAIVLDDGFQHRRLHRDVDVVCLDAHRPFGNGSCLPAGDLREFRSGLRRAGVVLLTRAGDLDADAIAARGERVRGIAGRPQLPVLACEHAPSGVVAEPAGTVADPGTLRGRRVVLLSAIARPDAFRATAEALGADIAGEVRYRDHHRFAAAEVEAAAAAARRAGGALLTTEKDDARLAGFAVERLVLRVDLRFVGDEPCAEDLRL